MSSVQKTGIAVAATVLGALLVVVANEVLSFASREATIAAIYEQQLDAILFSVNQHAWNVVDSWADDADAELVAAPNIDAARQALASLVEQVDEIDALFTADARGERVVVVRPGTAEVLSDSRDALVAGGLPGAVAQLQSRAQSDYRPLAPLTESAIDPDSLSTIIFLSDSPFPEAVVVGLVIDSERFVRNIIGRRLRDLGGDQFELSVRVRGARRNLVTGGADSVSEPDIVRPIWVFEDFEVGIRAAGGGIRTLARGRMIRSLALVGMLAAAVFLGIWFLYRNVKRESDLAQLKSDFVSNVSHELRTPLSVISMYADTLRLGRVTDPEKRLAYYQIVSDEAERLSHLVSNVLNFASIASGTKRYAREPVDLGDVVHEVVEAYRSHLERDDFVLTVHVQEKELCVLGDRGALKEAVINLIDNAVKYSSSDRYVGVRCASQNGIARLSVEDHGVGIDSREHQRIFEKFYRAERGLVHDVKGTGLGLALVQHIVQAHSGRVHVESKPEAGSTFILEFPLHTQADPASGGA